MHIYDYKDLIFAIALLLCSVLMFREAMQRRSREAPALSSYWFAFGAICYSINLFIQSLNPSNYDSIIVSILYGVTLAAWIASAVTRQRTSRGKQG